MIHLFNSRIGRLRLLGYLEGLSLLVLVFVAMPLKYMLHQPQLTKSLGPIHGALFILFILNTMSVAIDRGWTFKSTTWKIMLACMIPFGTFYIDYKLLKHLK